MTYRLILIVVLFIAACSTDEKIATAKKIINPHQFALPDAEVEVETELSEIDKQKLATAKGKVATSISLDNLNATLENIEEKVAVCYFWEEMSVNNKEDLQKLNKITNQIGADKFKVLLIYTAENLALIDLNSIVRASGIDAETYFLTDKMELGDMVGDNEASPIQLPAYFIYQPEDKIGLWLDGRKEEAEMYTMFQTYVF